MRFKRSTLRALPLLSALLITLTPIYAANDEAHPMNEPPKMMQRYQEESLAANTYEGELPNGLSIIVRKDERAPVVTNMVWYRVGSVDEPRGLGGISHMLEHMMFKGTELLGPNEHSTIIANLGGRDNAFTSMDYTAYYERLPAWELETALQLEAERMSNLKLRAEDFLSERLVVAEERRQRTESNPQGRFFELFNATLWSSSAYRNPIIGWMEEIERWRLSDLERWYQQYYAPNNATLVVVGDVDPEEVYQLAQRYFGPIPKRDSIEHPFNFEPQQEAEKRIEMVAEVNMPLLLMGYKVPSLNSAESIREAYALLLINELLDGGRAARLTKELVRKEQLALQTSAYYGSNRRYLSSLTISAIPTKGITLSELEEGIKRSIERLKQEPISDEELARVKRHYEWKSITALDSSYAQAMAIGTAETTGEGWYHRLTLAERLNEITKEEIQQVAQKYLHDQNLTVGYLHNPKSQEPHLDE